MITEDEKQRLQLIQAKFGMSDDQVQAIVQQMDEERRQEQAAKERAEERAKRRG